MVVVVVVDEMRIERILEGRRLVVQTTPARTLAILRLMITVVVIVHLLQAAPVWVMLVVIACTIQMVNY